MTTTKQSITKLCPYIYIYRYIKIGYSSPFYHHGLTLIPTRICNYIHYKVWDEITHPFPNFNSATIDIWEWISNSIPHCPCNYLSMPGLNNVSKRACRCHTFISFACSLWQNFFLVNFLLEYQTEGSRFHKILLLRIHEVHLHFAICHSGPYHMIFDPGKVFEKSLFFILQNLWESLGHFLIGAECLF